MILFSELRVDSLVEYKGTLCRVVSLDVGDGKAEDKPIVIKAINDYCDGSSFDTWTSEIDAAVIDRDVLTALGFVESVVGYYKHNKYELFRVWFDFTKLNLLSVGLKDRETSKIDHIGRVRFAHKLQDVCFEFVNEII